MHLSKEKIYIAKEVANKFITRFGDEMRTKRQAYGMTQEELRILLNECGIQVTQGYLSLLEMGQRQEPRIKLVIAIASLLDIALDDITSSNT